MSLQSLYDVILEAFKTIKKTEVILNVTLKLNLNPYGQRLFREIASWP